MDIYIARHAESKSRKGMNHEEGACVGLSWFGKVQAYFLGKHLKKKGIKYIVSSPLARAKETAEIVSKITGASLEIDDRFSEYAPSRTLKGSAFKKAKQEVREDRDFIPENGESFNQSISRFENGLNEYAKKYTESFCIVSHALIMQNMLMEVLQKKKPLHIQETAVTHIEYNNGNIEVHLSNTSPSFIVHFFSRVRGVFKDRLWE